MGQQQLELWNRSPAAVVSIARARPAAPAMAPSSPALGVAPSPLAELDAHAQRLLDSARGARTREAYARDWRGFERWCAQHGLPALPASTVTLTRYLTHLAEGGRKVSTVRRARIAIGLTHADHGAPRPDQDARIRLLERGLAKTHGAREQSARPLLIEDLGRIVAQLGAGARDERDRALLLVGFWGAMRGSELAQLRVEHIEVRGDVLRVLIERSKEDPLGLGQTVEIARAASAELCAIDALHTWTARVGQGAGALFRQVLGERVQPHAMSPRAIARVVERAALRAGLAHAELYSAHSLRAGLATSAYVRGVSERDIQAHGRWRDRRSLDRYIQLGTQRDRPSLVSAFL